MKSEDFPKMQIEKCGHLPEKDKKGKVRRFRSDLEVGIAHFLSMVKCLAYRRAGVIEVVTLDK